MDERLSRRRGNQGPDENGGPGGGDGEEEEGTSDVNVPSSSSATADNSGVSSAPLPTPGANYTATSSLHFLNLQNATTCQNYTFSWTYDGPVLDSNITLSVVQDPLGRSVYTSKLTAVRLLSSDIPASETNFTWEQVDLKEGWYMLEAQMPDQGPKFLPRMSPLYVVNGTNTTCVKYSKPDMNSRPRLTTGDIAGVIIGAIAAAGLLAVAFIFPRLWRRDLPSLKKRRPYYLY